MRLFSRKTKCSHIYDAHLVYDDKKVCMVHIDFMCIACKQHLRIDVTPYGVDTIMNAVYNK